MPGPIPTVERRSGSRLGRVLQIWVVVCIALVATVLLMTDGEPVCEGVLIYDTDDSDPPQCNSVLDGLFRFAPFLLFAGVIITAAIEGLWRVAGRVRSSPS